MRSERVFAKVIKGRPGDSSKVKGPLGSRDLVIRQHPKALTLWWTVPIGCFTMQHLGRKQSKEVFVVSLKFHETVSNILRGRLEP